MSSPVPRASTISVAIPASIKALSAIAEYLTDFKNKVESSFTAHLTLFVAAQALGLPSGHVMSATDIMQADVTWIVAGRRITAVFSPPTPAAQNPPLATLANGEICRRIALARLPAR
jgi:hypothetical protein